MMRSLFSAISGLKGHQTMMDVVGNNIANVNTTGFKTGRITFEDIISQTLRNGSATQNPVQVGLGMQTGSIDTIMTQGNLQSTGKPTDLAIQGDGFFQVSDGTNTFYTRDGNFSIDPTGTFLIQAATGFKLTGATVTNGVVNTSSIQLANFKNPAGLEHAGGNLFKDVPASTGGPTTGAAGSTGFGTIQTGFLEMSNVDLAQQFSNMIIAQRGFQANSRVITASDEILQDLVNIKR
jgi:flagellar hook protein FlgE